MAKKWLRIIGVVCVHGKHMQNEENKVGNKKISYTYTVTVVWIIFNLLMNNTSMKHWDKFHERFDENFDK